MALTCKQEMLCDSYLSSGGKFFDCVKASGYELPSIEQCSFYVYMLVDPRDGKVFYVGKGDGSRIRHHVRDAKRGAVSNANKHKHICEIHESGMQVQEVVFHAAETEDEAFIVERELISRLAEHGLTNIAGGIMTNAEVAQERAKHALKLLKPFDRWLVTASKRQIEAAEAMEGGAREFYEKIKATLQRYAAGDFVTE